MMKTRHTKNILAVIALGASLTLVASLEANAFGLDTISAWSKKKVEPLAYQIATSGSNLRGYSWCDPQMKVFVFYGASSKGGNFSVSSVQCKPK